MKRRCNNMFIISNNTKTIENNDDILVANTKTNKFFKVNKIYYEVIEDYIRRYGSIEELVKSFDDDKVCMNIQKLFDMLCKIKAVVEEDDEMEINPLDKVILNCTNRCNLHCKHCCNNSGINEKDILTTEKIKDIIDTISNHNPRTLLITGGEPLIRKDMIEILKYAREKFKGYIILNTNSLLINESNINEIINIVDQIAISLDGVDEKTTSIIRGKGVFTRAIKIIQFIKSKGFNKISASMTLTRDNAKYCDQFKELCDKYDLHPVFRRYADVGRGKTNKESLMGDIKLIALETQNDVPASCRECKPGKREIYINHDGNIYPCQTLSEKRFCLGNAVEQKGILDKLLSESDDFFNNIFDKERPCNNEKCKDCKVNLFCWSCLGHYLRASRDKAFFKEICSYKKCKLIEKVW
jgi:radical SAM protein with 4Fe4S-binding SPASM domain